MGIQIKEFLKQPGLKLKLCGGEKGLLREVTTSRIQKTGLLLTGAIGEQLYPDRVQIFGAAEVAFLKAKSDVELRKSLKIFSPAGVPAIILTRGLVPPQGLKRFCDDENIALLASSSTSSVFIENFIKYLEEKLAPTTIVHGVLVDILGVGILITGRSGIGKSECALDLISRGYRLVADDAVIVSRSYPSTLFGTSHDNIRYLIEVRGIGIVNVKDLFGITGIRESKQMDLVVELVNWDPSGEYDRLGFEEKKVEILGVELPQFSIPVSPGRSVATIVEVAARNQILKIMGMHDPNILQERFIPEAVQGAGDKAKTLLTRKKSGKKGGKKRPA